MSEQEKQHEQDMIKQLLSENIVDRGLEDEFGEYIQDLQETSQIDMSDYGYKKMKEWLYQFLLQKNLPLLNSHPEKENENNSDNSDSKSTNINDNLIQSERSISDEKKKSSNKQNNQNYNTSPHHQQNNIYQQQNQQQQVQKQQFNGGVDDSLFDAMDLIMPGQGDQFKNDNLFDSYDEIPPFQPNQQKQPQGVQYQTQIQNQNLPLQQKQIQNNTQPYQNGSSNTPQSKQQQTQQQNSKQPAKSFEGGNGNNNYYNSPNNNNLTAQPSSAKQSFAQNGQNTPSYGGQITSHNQNKPQIQQRQYTSQIPDISCMPEFKNQVQGVNLTQQFGEYSVIHKQVENSKFITTEEQIKLIEQFEKQLKDREYLNASQIINCNKMELNKIGKFMKAYPEKKPRVTIQSYRILEEGFLKQNYVLYTVSMSELGWTCYRRYSDFKVLRAIFEDQYPGYFVPPIPKRKTIKKKFEPEYLEKRMMFLEQFMEAVLESDLLRNSQQIEDFLFIQDEGKYRRVAENIKKGPIDLNQFYSVDGKINCKNSTNFQNYGSAFKNYTQNLTNYYGQAKQLTKDVVKNLDESQKSLKSLSTVFSDLSKLTSDFNQRNKIGVNTYLQKQYEENSKFLSEYAEFLDKQQNLFKNFIYLKMRYEKKVCSVFEEMSNRHNILMVSFQEAFSKLNQKKQKLFDKKDIKAWELPPNLPVEQLSLIQDQKLAFKYMLPKETQIVKQMNKKINFFNSNLFYETRKYLKIRETKISSDFIQFTAENGQYLGHLKQYHDKHLERLNLIVKESQINLVQQIEEDKKIIDQSINGTFLTDSQTRKVIKYLEINQLFILKNYQNTKDRFSSNLQQLFQLFRIIFN